MFKLVLKKRIKRFQFTSRSKTVAPFDVFYKSIFVVSSSAQNLGEIER